MVPTRPCAGLVVPAVHMAEFELSDPTGGARSLIATNPQGTLRAAQKTAQRATEKAEKAKGATDKAASSRAAAAAASDSLHVYVKARIMPHKEGGSRPWVWAGPIRAWSVDYEKKSADGKPAPGLWMCCKSVAFFAPLASASVHAEPHARSWFTGDGLRAFLATELLRGCREHRDPRTAVRLYNNLVSAAWARLPHEISGKFGMRREVLYEKEEVAAFVMEALEDSGHREFAKKVGEARADHNRRVEQKASRPPPVQPPTRRPAVPATVSPALESAGAKRSAGEGGLVAPPEAKQHKGSASRSDGTKNEGAPRSGGGMSTGKVTAAPELSDAEVTRTML